MLRIATASLLLWPWLRMGLLPPVESMRMSDQKTPVLICTDATLLMGILSSALPKNRGLVRSTRSGPTSIRVGKRKLPRVQRLALNILLELEVIGGVDMDQILLRASVRLRGIIRFSLLHRFLPAPAQNKRTPPTPLHTLVNLLPEAPEVIDSRNQRDGHHEPNGHPRHQVHVQNEREHTQIEIPRVPAQGQNRGHHGDNLHHHLQFAQLAGFNGKALRGGYSAQAADQKFPADN